MGDADGIVLYHELCMTGLAVGDVAGYPFPGVFRVTTDAILGLDLFSGLAESGGEKAVYRMAIIGTIMTERTIAIIYSAVSDGYRFCPISQ